MAEELTLTPDPLKIPGNLCYVFFKFTRHSEPVTALPNGMSPGLQPCVFTTVADVRSYFSELRTCHVPLFQQSLTNDIGRAFHNRRQFRLNSRL